MVRRGPGVRRSGLAALLAIVAGLCLSAAARAQSWHDTFYQYRIPLVIESESAGWHEVLLSSGDLVTAINATEELKYDPLYFAHNHVKVVLADEAGAPTGGEVDVAFHLIAAEENLLEGVALVGHRAEVDVEPGATYLLTYTTAFRAGNALTAALEPIFPVLHTLRQYAAVTSHEPRYRPLAKTTSEVLIMPNTARLPLDARTYASERELRDASLRRADIRLLANLPAAGRYALLLYYQPLNGLFLTVPDRRHPEVPVNKARVTAFGHAEKHLGATRHPVMESEAYSAWFADTTVKLTPATPVPANDPKAIRIHAAARESQSFQLVLRPKKAFDFRAIDVSDLTTRDHRISSEHVDALRVDYVPITAHSFLTPVRYLGPLADPLVAIGPQRVSPVEGNVAFWVTVNVPADTPAGVYEGTITIRHDRDFAEAIPLSVEVFDFELPEFSPFYSSMGGAHITKSPIPGDKAVSEFHRAVTREQVRELARNYYDLMARNKFTPHNAAQYSRIGMEWSPPPQGMNVDAPGNFFRLHDWDFTEFNEDLRHYINDLKVNAFTLVHTDPSAITMFHHLPGREREQYDRHPQYLSLEWQTWRQMTVVGYDKREKDAYLEITRAQYDDLVMQFYRRIAENLEEHGWLDYAYILVDETAERGYEPLLHFLRLLKSDPLTARIRIVWTIQSLDAFNHKTRPEDDHYAFNGWLDVYVPETNENHHMWEKYYFTDYDIEPTRDKLWNYVTYTTRVAMDTPGVNNRAIALEVFRNGGNGFLDWGTFIWDSQSHQESNHSNPWEQPWTRWGNGAMAYFYPPRKAGPSHTFDPTVIPSLRIMTYRESVDDYEYAWLLERLVQRARDAGTDTSEARAVLSDIERFFNGAVHWSQNDAWYLELRLRMARAIERLQAASQTP